MNRVARRFIDALLQPWDPGHLGAHLSHLARCTWRVMVLRSNKVTTHLIAGGQIFVHTGVRRLQPRRCCRDMDVITVGCCCCCIHMVLVPQGSVWVCRAWTTDTVAWSLQSRHLI